MTPTERMTVSLPADVGRAAQRAADISGVTVSAVLQEALDAWLRPHLVDTWLAQHQNAHGPFDEDELERLAKASGVPYMRPALLTNSLPLERRPR